MEHTINSPTKQVHRFSLTTLMLIGGAAGLAVISVFVFHGINYPNPEWSKYWMIRPLIVTPSACAAAGIWYYLMDNFRYQGGWKMALAYLASFMGLIIALWLGIVLGLAGTMWH